MLIALDIENSAGVFSIRVRWTADHGERRCVYPYAGMHVGYS